MYIGDSGGVFTSECKGIRMRLVSSGKLYLALAVACSAQGAFAAAEPGENTWWGAEKVTQEKKTTGFIPSVQVRQGYTDNVYRAPKNEKHSWITTVKPGAELKMQKGVNKYTLGANTVAGYYTIDSRNDYVDWSGYARGEFEFDPRNHLDAGAKMSHKHDPIGTGASEGKAVIQGEPDEYTQTDGDLKYTYGAKGAKGKLVLRDLYLNKEYTNNRDNTERLDRTDNEVRATAYWRAMPKTTFLVEGREKSIDYLQTATRGSIYDSDETKQYIGVEWEATAKTTGSVRLGHVEKRPDADHGNIAKRDDFDSPIWESSVTWQPLSYSGFTLDYERSPTEATTGGVVFIDRTDTKLTWRHEWSSYLSSKVFARRYSDDYVTTPRSDDVDSIGAGLEYTLNHWVDLSADYLYEDKNSTFDNNDYNGSVMIFGVKFAMD